MVFVKVRETYDLHTIQNKMSVIGIHTPNGSIIKKNFPGLLMQCKTYRPVSCDVQIACASMLPADPLQVGVAEGDIAPEDLFNPILYKAMTNLGMSQIEARVNAFTGDSASITPTSQGNSASIKNDGLTDASDEFDLYYGLLSDTYQWRHANPQAGLSMKGLKPLVYEMLYSVGDNCVTGGNSSLPGDSGGFWAPASNGGKVGVPSRVFKGRAHEMPMINCSMYTATGDGSNGVETAGFTGVTNAEITVPAPEIYVGAIIIPPSRLHQLFYRMVVEWTLEFSQIRSIHEITNWIGLTAIGQNTHFQDYDYSAAKSIAGIEGKTFSADLDMVSANVDVNKVM